MRKLMASLSVPKRNSLSALPPLSFTDNCAVAAARELLPANQSNRGIVSLGSELKHWFHEERPVSLLRSSIPCGNHQLCRLGLPSFLPELPGCRGSSGRTRDHRLL